METNHYNPFDANPAAPEVTAPRNNFAANEFRPDARKAPGHVFNAVVRFLPDFNKIERNLPMHKYTSFMQNPLTKQQREVDCPQTKGLDDPIQTTFFRLWNSEFKDKFSRCCQRTDRYTALVQVVQCTSDPSLEGKVLVWRFGNKIWQKIDAEWHPKDGSYGRNPFNPLEGRAFSVEGVVKGGFNNLDSSAFKDFPAEIGAIRFGYNNQWVLVTQNVKDDVAMQNAFVEYMKSVSPSLDPYDYHEWNDDTRKWVSDTLAVLNDPNTLYGIMNNTAQYQQSAMTAPGSAYSTQPAAMPQIQPTQPLNNAVPGGFNPMMGGAPQVANAPQNIAPTYAPTPSAAPAPSVAPATPSAPSMPQMGGSPASMTAPSGFGTSSNAVADVMSGINPTPSAPSTPSAAPTDSMNLDDVLGGII